MENQIIPKSETNSAMHFFLFLLTYLSLGFVAYGVGNILFEATNKIFIDDVLGYSYAANFDQGAVKFGIASLFVAGPLFFYLMHIIAKFLHSGEIKNESKIRRWLTYIVIFISAAVIIGDLITLIVYFLDGDFTTRFLLKVLVTLLISGLIFRYYFINIRRAQTEGMIYSVDKIYKYIGIAIVTVTFIAGFFLIDSPRAARAKKIDSATAGDLNMIESTLDQYYDKTKTLPQSLSDLKGTTLEIGGNINSSIVYERFNEKQYQLCADFKSVDLENANKYDNPNADGLWFHGIGRTCFKRTVIDENPLESTKK